MKRATVNYIAALVGCHRSTIRKLADKGLIESRRDYNGWRIFPEPEETIQKAKELLGLDDSDEEFSRRAYL